MVLPDNASNILPVEYLNFIRFDNEDIFPKYTTIRAGSKWQPGDIILPVAWLLPGGRFVKGNKRVQFADEFPVVKTWDFEIKILGMAFINNKRIYPDFLIEVAKNDGLNYPDFLAWFKYPKPFKGQIICWSDKVNY